MPTDHLDLAPTSEIVEINGRRPLENSRREAFARLVACRYLSAKSAYREVYGDESSDRTAESSSSEIMSNAEVKARIEHLKTAVTEKSTFLAARKLQYLESAILTPPSQIDIDSPLCNGSKPGKDGSVQILIPDKLAALKLHAMLSGELVTASSVEVKVAIFGVGGVGGPAEAPAIDI